MRIHRIILWNYRGTVEHTLEFCDGVTVVEGCSEVGRSTLIEALRHLRLHKASTSRKEVYDTQSVGRDVDSEAEVELNTGEYYLIYCKRWLKGRKTELSITTSHPEKLSEDGAHERFLQVVAETTDDGLFEALEVTQGNSLGRANLARLPALHRTLDGAGPSTGEHDALLEVVEKEYLRHLTPTGKPTGDCVQGQRDLEALTGKTWPLGVASQETDSLIEKHEKVVAARDAKKKRLGQACQQEAESIEESRFLDELRQRVEQAAARVAEADAARETTERLVCEREDVRVRVRELDATLAETFTGIEWTRRRASNAQDALAFRAEKARNAGEEEGVLGARLRGTDNRVWQARDMAELEALKERLEHLTEAE